MSGIAERLAEALAAHESLLGSDDYRACICGDETGTLGGLRAHVAQALLPVVEREIAAARGEALREAADRLPHAYTAAALLLEDMARAALSPDPDRGEGEA